MNQSNLKPAGQLAQRFGVKAILYGKPGTGKTPMLNTCPRPLLLACEAGLKSMKGSTIPTWEAFTPEAIKEFFDWFFKSNEAKNFDTLGIDSGSQLAEIILAAELKINKDPRKSYGNLSLRVMEWINPLYFMPQKHLVVICKQTQVEVGTQLVKQDGAFVVETSYQAQPYFPGQDLNVKIPHLFDDILYVGLANVQGVQEKVVAIHSKFNDKFLARNRTNLLEALEPPHLGNLISKLMS